MAAIGTALTAGASPSIWAWPPPEDAILKHGPKVLVSAMAACAATMAASVLMKEESHTPDVLKVRSRRDLLQAKAVSNARLGKESASASAALGQGGQAPGAMDVEYWEWHAEEMEKRKPKLLHFVSLASKSLESGGKCTVRFKEMFEACIGVRHLNRSDPDLANAFQVCISVLAKEIEEQKELTREGRTLAQEGGEDLADLIARYSTVHAMCRGLVADGEQRRQLWAKVHGLWWTSLAGQLTLWRMRLPDVIKACKVVLLAKRYVPLLFISSGLRVAGNSMGALETLYRAEAWETFRKPAFAVPEVMAKLRACLLIGGVKAMLTLAGDRMNLSALMRMSHKLRTEVFSAMLRQDLEWYRLGRQDQRNVQGLFDEIFQLPTLTENFVKAAARVAEAVSTGYVMGTLIRQRSTGMISTLVITELLSSAAKVAFEVTSTWLKGVLTRTMTTVELNWAEPLMPENVSTLRACAAEGRALRNWNMFWRSYHEMQHMQDLVDRLSLPLDAMRSFLGWRHYLSTAARLLRDGSIFFAADVQALCDLTDKAGEAVRQAVTELRWVQDSIPKLARYYEVIFSEPTIGLEGGTVPGHARAKGHLEFRGVTFQYPGTGDVISNVSFELPAQQTCGVTGSSGAGKSTLLLLMQRLYDPREGEILLDGMDIRTLNPMWLRRQVAVVSQRPRIFQMSLKRNLTYGCEMEPSEDEVEAACKAACIHELIFQNPARFPLGLHTRVSSETLSGGELQRVAIARALLKDSPVLLLDEATSALDSESQSLVKAGLRNLMNGRTVIVVAHRLETIKDADSILCVEEGRVAERGTHEELVQAGGLYSRLYREQIEATMSNAGAAIDSTDALEIFQAGLADNAQKS